MNKVKSISKIICKNKRTLSSALSIILAIAFLLYATIAYVFEHRIEYLIAYTAIVSLIPIILSLLIYFLFTNSKMIIFRNIYKISFSCIILTITSIVSILVIVTLLPLVYYAFSNNETLILFFIYIVVFECSLNLFAVYLTLFLKNRKLSFMIITIITQALLSINSLNLVSDPSAKFVAEHFSIVGILLANKINWISFSFITLIPILLLLSIMAFINKINWTFYVNRK